MLNSYSNISLMNKLNSFINKQIELFFNQRKKQKKGVCNIYFWPACKVVSSVHTSWIMFHFYFLQPTVHLIRFTYHSPSRLYLSYLVIFILHGHSTSLQFHYSSNPVSGKFLISDRYSLLESEHRWFYYSLSLYIEQKIQQLENTSSLHAAITSKKAF